MPIADVNITCETEILKIQYCVIIKWLNGHFSPRPFSLRWFLVEHRSVARAYPVASRSLYLSSRLESLRAIPLEPNTLRHPMVNATMGFRSPFINFIIFSGDRTKVVSASSLAGFGVILTSSPVASSSTLPSSPKSKSKISGMQAKIQRVHSTSSLRFSPIIRSSSPKRSLKSSVPTAMELKDLSLLSTTD